MIYFLSFLSSFSTFILRRKFKVDAIYASIFISLIGFFLCRTLFFLEVELYSSIVFGASFVGMTKLNNFSYFSLFLATMLYSSMFTVYMSWFSGLGGALGFSAFLSVLIIVIFVKLKERILKLRG